jgi:hypothetical protein
MLLNTEFTELTEAGYGGQLRHVIESGKIAVYFGMTMRRLSDEFLRWLTARAPIRCT